MSENETVTVRDAWYTADGPELDVVLSTRVRLARNLANFLFPSVSSPEELERVQSLVFGAFSTMENPDSYQAICVKNLEAAGCNIFIERGVLSLQAALLATTGLIIRTDGRLSVSVNYLDHIHLASFTAGLNLQSSYDICKKVDDDLQKSLQFAASFEFGYLNSRVDDTGTGMKASVRLHIPSIVHSGQLKDVIALIPNGYTLSDVYYYGQDNENALGSFYQLSTSKCFPDCEYDQLDNLAAITLHIIEIERKARANFADNKPTLLRDYVYRSYAEAKYSRMLSCKDAVVILSNIKWGIDCGILEGTTDSVLAALLFRVQPAHLGFVIKSGNFRYEKDISSKDLQINRLRSLVIQETIDHVQIKN